MRKLIGVAKVDLIVAVACMVFVLANVQVITAGGRGRAKLQVCLSNLRTLTAAWHAYADDNGGNIAFSDVWYSRQSHARDYGGYGPGWYEWPHLWNTTTNPSDGSKLPPHDFTREISAASRTKADWEHAIACGVLWKYIYDYRIYACPTAGPGAYVSYSIVDSMNGYCCWDSHTLRMKVKNLNQIPAPAERLIFLDRIYPVKGCFSVFYTQHVWASPLPKKGHPSGCTVSFADGHAEFYQYKDSRTVDAYWREVPYTCNPDLIWLQKGTYGKLGYPLPDDCP